MLFSAVKSPIALAVVVLVGGTIPALAQTESLGRFGDWSAFVETTGARKVCYLGAAPRKAEGKYTSRGKVYLLVSHRPADKVSGEVSIEAGYAFKDGFEPNVVIDGKTTFKMFTRGENAWNYDAKGDRAMIEAMKSGAQMVVKGRSARGTATTDTYELAGFSAAFAAIGKACDVK